MEKYGFVYLWYDKKRKRFYVGSHWGTEDDGYTCSSNWMRDAHRRRPKDFKRRIVKRIFTNPRETLIEEYRYLLMIKKEELRKRYYNVRIWDSKDSWFADKRQKEDVITKLKRRKRTPEQRARMSLAQRNSMTDERRKRISEASKRQMTPEARAHLSVLNRGRKPLIETIEKIRKIHIGRRNTIETKEKMRQAAIKRDSVGMMWIFHPNLNQDKRIPKEEFHLFEQNGWIHGRLYRTKTKLWVHHLDLQKSKKVKECEIENFLMQGWLKGRGRLQWV
jgi:hypothetical protein